MTNNIGGLKAELKKHGRLNIVKLVEDGLLQPKRDPAHEEEPNKIIYLDEHRTVSEEKTISTMQLRYG